MLNNPVLILNQNYQPLNVCNARRALVLLNLGKAELMQDSVGQINTVSKTFDIPSIIRLYRMVKIPLNVRRLSRIGVFVRDKHKCQYCGVHSKTLTLDHVIPRSKGGQHEWDNLVSACNSCNNKKAGRNPVEAGMKLIKPPSPPRPNPFYLVERRTILSDWKPFIPWLVPQTIE
ncbi:MAG: 5-methylcytosine-specific restriction endonuclease McrA [Chloroflexi bacterium]|jgi:5-methylcytosine-specific restriction endonuclease McrA|nr:MAG: 5-methylcytosine-specific restriction endonuclease McrA [Chloroflexota bacterium]